MFKLAHNLRLKADLNSMWLESLPQFTLVLSAFAPGSSSANRRKKSNTSLLRCVCRPRKSLMVSALNRLLTKEAKTKHRMLNQNGSQPGGAKNMDLECFFVYVIMYYVLFVCFRVFNILLYFRLKWDHKGFAWGFVKFPNIFLDFNSS